MSDLDAFARAFAARRDQVADRMMEACREHVPGILARSSEGFRRRVDQDVDAQLAALGDAEARALRESAQRWCREALTYGIPPEVLLRLIEASRRVLLEEALALHAEGVPGATAGIRRLMTAQSEVVRAFDAFFRDRAEASHRQAQIFEEFVRYAPYGIGISDEDGVISYTNRAYRELMGAPEEPLEGRTVASLLTDESRAVLRGEARAVTERDEVWTGPLYHQRPDGVVVETKTTTFLVHDPARGAMKCALVRDMVAVRRAEQTRRALEEEVMAAQDAALRELGTPLVPIADGVVAMPLVGAIDEARAARMLEVLLEGIARERAGVAILDITGVREMDTTAAGGLLAAAHAARLLGAEVVLTGVQPAVAQALVGIDARLGSIATRATLAEGLAFAFGRARR
jgi:rsbT co-antagonist protein RsbR